MLQQIKLLDASGTAMQLNGANGPNGVGNNRLDYTVTYVRRNADDEDKKVGKPSKLVLSVPVETKQLEFNFEFKDLPLPH